MNNVSVNSIQKICRPIGGLKSAMFIVSEHPDVIIPRSNHAQAAADIEFNGNESTTVFYVNFRTSSAIFNEDKLTDSPAGDNYVYVLEGWIQRRRKETVDLVYALENRVVHCVITDRNGEATLVKNLRHSSKYASGDRIGSPNGYTFQFRVVTPEKAPRYGFTLPDPGEPPIQPEVSELQAHHEFLTTGTNITPPDFQDAFLVFRDNIHLPEDRTPNGYTNNSGTGITLTEPIRTDNPAGGEWITVLYKTST